MIDTSVRRASRVPLAPTTVAAMTHVSRSVIEAAACRRERLPHPLPAPCAGAALPLSALDVALAALDRRHLPVALARMLPVRLRAFLAGRLCAELALADLDCETRVGRGPAGEPLWPQGTVGSIAHTDDMAYATVARAAHVSGIGIDSEGIVDADGAAAIRADCCLDDERHSLFGRHDESLVATILFCAKESLYKAVHRHVGRMLEFTEVRLLEIDHAAGRFMIQPSAGVVPPGMHQTFEGHHRVVDNRVHASVTLDAAA